MKYLFLILIVFCPVLHAAAQVADTNYLKQLYDRSVNFSEEKLDSISWNAKFIEKQSAAIGFKKGKILSQRLFGLHSELSGNYNDAIRYFLSTLSASREGHYPEYEISALSDLAITYTEIKQPEKAKEVYMECLKLTRKRGEISSIISGYSNMGAIYNILNEPDSALYYLTAALQLCKQHNNQKTLPFIYNNTGNVYFKKKEFSKAIEYFRLNKALHDSTNSQADLWIDYLNIGDCFIELSRYDSATYYTQRSLEIAQKLGSKSKEADSYALIAKLYERLGQYKKALDFQRRWYKLDTALVNEASSRTIAEMQERFHAQDREKQNQLLLAEVGQEKLRNRYLSYLTAAAVLIGLLVGIFLLVYWQANQKLKEVNQVIGKQKEKLSALNQEKNSLISIVSHDLSTPFASIAMWSHLINEDSSLSDDQRKALGKIRDSAQSGERLIRNILDIEKQGTSTRQLEIEDTNMGAFVAHVVLEHQHTAESKNITLIGPDANTNIFLLTDQDLVKRIIDNLVSNAIKFSPPGKKVWVEVTGNENRVILTVRDEGVGIPDGEKKLLFTKYAQLSPRPTAGEESTGLGLSIVKRLVNELNGTISFSSEEGKGTSFEIQFEK
ncbi:tetratricopeptide repeat-containing sensor histidine kinase [Flavihumibacter profundi]|uniref:tetratricopeptide repeat-containing sensor histidine kinase n=1 Tax=Flavihumibacter profundi TaxID=2716883 RepID=UPI001CC4797A|nr:ATP-binding protein [Flavihumibacter profundi]MBZ5858193.1 tetratricopeptide repeat protein [Flavihumibacter profundi]